MGENGPKVEFALGSKVTSRRTSSGKFSRLPDWTTTPGWFRESNPIGGSGGDDVDDVGAELSTGHFFKSSFARSFVTNCRDAKSLDLEFLDNGTVAAADDVADAERRDLFNDSKNNNSFFSLTNFGSATTANDNGNSSGPRSSTWQTFNEPHSSAGDIAEMDKLRKQCQTLTEENRRLAESLQANQVPRVQVIDNVFLQTQIDTLQWQLKQTEANRQMYRSLMGQVVRFLERAQKSLDTLHEKSNLKGKGSSSSSSRVPRSRSVHAVDQDTSRNRDSVIGDSSIASSSNAGSSRFARAKSVAQIAPHVSGCSGFREFTWSVLRRNDPAHCTPPRNKPPPPPSSGLQDLNQTHEGVVYRRPKQQAEVDPDTVPPEKLSQEAFRLMRTVQSLLAMREPDLALLPSTEEDMSTSPMEHDELSSLQSNNNFANSTTLHDTLSYNGGCSSSDRGSTESGAESERTSFPKSSSSAMESSISSTSTLQSMLLPGARRSLDATSFVSSRVGNGGKTTEEEEDDSEDTRANSTASSASIVSRELFASREASSSTPNRRPAKKFEKKHESGGSGSRWSRSKPKPANSVSSAEDESGFSSMSSFQEVGLPLPFATPISPIKGCHTEIGLPEVPLDKVRHRRWSSTPVEIQAMLKRHSGHFSNASSNAESLSVWV